MSEWLSRLQHNQGLLLATKKLEHSQVSIFKNHENNLGQFFFLEKEISFSDLLLLLFKNHSFSFSQLQY